MERAVAISFNWETHKVLYTDFEGPEAAVKADAWVAKGSFLWDDFPASEGWVHFAYWNKEAGEEYAKQIGKSYGL